MTDDHDPRRWSILTRVAVAELLCMALWFGVSSVTPALRTEWNLSDSAASWMTIAVQLGFVAGTLISAILNLSDLIPTRQLFAVSALLGAGTNALLAATSESASSAIVLRFLTGMFLAGIYPPGMRILATWFRRERGLALGVLVGSLTLGKASPYLVNALGSDSWRINVGFASFSSLLGGAIVFFLVTEGPFSPARARFDPGQVMKIFRERGVRLANFGYYGHMWELYAMWTWLPVMLRASFAESGQPGWLAEAGSFIVIGAGAAGCVAAGLLADRIGRTIVTSAAMIVSGACCLVIGFFYGGTPIVLLIIAAVWGATVVADSAQFSACVTELGQPEYMGTALTLQTSVGFLLTTISIAIIPPLVELLGWEWAFVILAPGPLFGVVSMMRLRRLPEAARLAGGAR
ncbi:MAG: nitrate/nitrite transporter [Thermoanaerobaculia bacterium]